MLNPALVVFPHRCPALVVSSANLRIVGAFEGSNGKGGGEEGRGHNLVVRQWRSD